MIFFTIVIPSFNRPDLALRAIMSAEKQMVAGDELYLVNDGSTQSYDVVEKYMSTKLGLNYLYNQDGGGVSSARNLGMKKARCQYIAFLDDDDEWLPGHLEQHRKIYSQYSDVAIAFSNFYNGHDDQALKPDGVSRWAHHKTDIRESLSHLDLTDYAQGVYIGDMYREQIMADHILPSALSFSRSIVGSDVFFEVGLKRNESWLFSSSCTKKGLAAFIDSSLVVQHAPPKVKRATAISEEHTMLSRIYVMSKVWARDVNFKKEYKHRFEKWYFNDFYGLVRSALSTRDFSFLYQAAKLIGISKAVVYCVKCVFYILLQKKPVHRNA